MKSDRNAKIERARDHLRIDWTPARADLVAQKMEQRRRRRIVARGALLSLALGVAGGATWLAGRPVPNSPRGKSLAVASSDRTPSPTGRTQGPTRTITLKDG